jgi:hypothetical protein
VLEVSEQVRVAGRLPLPQPVDVGFFTSLAALGAIHLWFLEQQVVNTRVGIPDVEVFPLALACVLCLVSSPAYTETPFQVGY